MSAIDERPVPGDEWKHGAQPWRPIEYELWLMRREHPERRPQLARQLLRNILEHVPYSAAWGEPCSTLRTLAEQLLPLLSDGLHNREE